MGRKIILLTFGILFFVACGQNKKETNTMQTTNSIAVTQNLNITAENLVAEVIKNKDLNAYLNLVREREELLEKTMYYSEKNKQEKRKSAEDLLNNADFELEPLFEETFQLEYQGYGKLATLVHLADDGEGIIRLKHKQNEGENIYLDFLFQRKIKGGKLSVI